MRQQINTSEESLCITLILSMYLSEGNKSQAIKQCAKGLVPTSPLMKEYLNELLNETIEGMVVYSVQQLELGLRKDNLL